MPQLIQCVELAWYNAYCAQVAATPHNAWTLLKDKYLNQLHAASNQLDVVALGVYSQLGCVLWPKCHPAGREHHCPVNTLVAFVQCVTLL